MKDIGSAFSALFNDPRWVRKTIGGGLVVLLCLVGLGFFVLAGYYIELTRRVMRREQYPIPEWQDLGVKFITGFKYFVVLFVYFLPALLLGLPLAVLMFVTAVFAPGGPLAILASIYLFGYALLMVPYSVLLMLLAPIIAFRFADRERIADALNVAEVFRAFGQNWESTLVVALLAAGVQSLAGLGIFAVLIGIVFSIFYAYLVTAYLHGLLYLAQREHEEAIAA